MSELIKKIGKHYAGFISILLLGLIVYSAFTFRLTVDEKEHIYATYSVFNGKIPYKDFFEHHHFLMWYFFAPMFYFFENTPIIFYALRCGVLLLFIGDMYFVYKIARISELKRKNAFIAVLFFIFFAFDQRGCTEYRPDTLMLFWFLCGLYYFFVYLKTKKLMAICVSFLALLFSFLSLQKIAVLLLPFIFVVLYLLVKKYIKIKDLILASILPILVLSLWVLYLYLNDGLLIYWEMSFLLNSYIKFKGLRIIHIYTHIYMWICGVISLYAIFKEKNLFIKILAALYLFCVLCLFVFVRPAFAHYLLPAYPLGAIIIAKYLFGKIVYKKYFDYIFYSLLVVVYILCYYYKFFYYRNPLTLQMYIGMEQKVLDYSEPDDLIIGCYDGWSYIGSLREEATGYWWFSQLYLGVIYNEKIKPVVLPNLDNVVKGRKPKIVCKSSWHGCYDKFSDDCEYSIGLDEEFMNEHYIDTGLFYLRK